MYHLAFETSCDDTSIALMYRDEVIALVTRSQLEEHRETQGVVPEVAARLHANVVFPVLEEVLQKGEVSLKDIAFFSCTQEPGLLPSLLVGRTVAKTLGAMLHKPVYWINHIEGHIFANLLERKVSNVSWPAVVLTISGGHNELYIWDELHALTCIWQTRDDAAGEAFDKVAKALGLGFPGGPIIDRLASEYTGERKRLFPVPLLEQQSLDFSFSWLKSAVKRVIDERRAIGELTHWDMSEIAFEFQHAIVEVLVTKLFRAAQQTGIRTLMLAGWVSANDLLRDTISLRAEQEGYAFFAPVKKLYSMDNAAMIGIRAWHHFLSSEEREVR